LQWSLADQRVFDVVRPLARRLVFGVIGSAFAKPTEQGVRRQTLAYGKANANADL